jgi:hypothetical protein
MDRTFTAEFTVASSRENVAGDALREFVPFFGREGFQVTAQSADGFTLSRRYLGGAAMIGGLLTFPLGIVIWALARRTQTVTFSFSAQGTGTRIIIAGQGPPGVHAYIAALAESAAAMPAAAAA